MEREERIKKRRELLEKILSAKRVRLTKSLEKKKFEDMTKSMQEKENMIKKLTEKLNLLEKELSQVKIDFKRYRSRTQK